LIGGGGALLGVMLVWLMRGDANADVLRVARAIPDGGKYCPIGETGVAHDVVFKGTPILKQSKSKGFHCCGYTFAVAMKVAEERGLLRTRDAYEVKAFQKEWYGATADSRIKQLIFAMERLRIGREVQPSEAKAGDFVIFTRDIGSGHSAVFLDWVFEKDVVVGFRYRTSQPETDGIANRVEYFTTSGYTQGHVLPQWFFLGRMY